MKKLVTLLAGIVLTASFTTGAFAQAAGPNGGGVQSGAAPQAGKQKGAHAPIGAKVLKQLNLTPDQQKQIKALVEDFRQKHEQEVKAGGKANRKENAELRKEFLESLGKILTPTQKDKLKQLMEEARNKKANKNSVPPPAAGTTSGGAAKTGGGGL